MVTNKISNHPNPHNAINHVNTHNANNPPNANKPNNHNIFKFSSFVIFLRRLENVFFRELLIKYFELTRLYSFTEMIIGKSIKFHAPKKFAIE